MRRAFCVLCLLFAFLLTSPFLSLAAPVEDSLPSANSTPPTTSARAMVLLDAESGTLLSMAALNAQGFIPRCII